MSRIIHNLSAEELQIALTQYLATREALHGTCSADCDTCPKHRCSMEYISAWPSYPTEYFYSGFCSICHDEFSWLRKKGAWFVCPCVSCADPEEVLLRLDELIEELEELLHEEHIKDQMWNGKF